MPTCTGQARRPFSSTGRNHSFFSVGKRVIIKKYIRFEILNKWIFTAISQEIEKSR